DLAIQKRMLELPPVWAVLLLLAALLAYLPSFNARFFLDDFRIILENPLLHDALDLGAIWRFSEARFIGSLTFAANYTLHGEAVFGYHLANLLIHLLAGLGLFWLVRGLIASPAMAGEGRPWIRWVPWIAVAVFLLHPLQTQAVTYIVQRYTSLMAMFYLVSMAAFIWARLRNSLPLLGLAATSLALAALSKQTAATLPLALLLIELIFFRRLSGRAWGLVLGSVAVAGILAAWLLSLPAFDIPGITRETDQISRADYLGTQMEVIWRYIGLFFLVGEQRLEYDIAIASGFSAPATLAMALGHCVLITAAATLWRKLPLVAFGILFYYLAHLVESSVLPIIDVAFEHRTYLPNAGFALAAGYALAVLVDRLAGYRAGAVATLVILAILTTSTYARNALWADRIEFLEHETQVTPTSQRAWTSLGKELMREARFEAALEALNQAARIAARHEGGALRPPTVLNMIFALHYTDRNREAIELARNTPLEEFNQTEQAFYFEARGRAYLALEEYLRARNDLQESARLNPTINAVSFLAVAELELGNPARAVQLARQVLEVEPENPLAKEILRRTR
ncbi:MAG TPA: hypothetical protein VKA18_04740, partial [Alphaproteobacteria bacterium]|nr:hypothetical protein [Alphaproteobacteria bacterium]